MSFCDESGAQLHPDEVVGRQLTLDEALRIARSIVHDESIPEDERMRLVWLVCGAAVEADPQ